MPSPAISAACFVLTVFSLLLLCMLVTAFSLLLLCMLVTAFSLLLLLVFSITRHCVLTSLACSRVAVSSDLPAHSSLLSHFSCSFPRGCFPTAGRHSSFTLQFWSAQVDVATGPNGGTYQCQYHTFTPTDVLGEKIGEWNALGDDAKTDKILLMSAALEVTCSPALCAPSARCASAAVCVYLVLSLPLWA